MKLLVAGATGGLGRVVVADAVGRGHEVSAVVRDPARSRLPEGVRVVRGDVLDPASLDAAVEGRDGVICALGTPSPRQASSLLEDGTRNLSEAMKRAGVPRLVCVTLLGTGDSKRNASLVYRHVILRALAPMVPDKDNRERVVRGSRLDRVFGATSAVRQPGRRAAPSDPGRRDGAGGACLPPGSRPRANRRGRTAGLRAPGDRCRLVSWR